MKIGRLKAMPPTVANNVRTTGDNFGRRITGENGLLLRYETRQFTRLRLGRHVSMRGPAGAGIGEYAETSAAAGDIIVTVSAKIVAIDAEYLSILHLLFRGTHYTIKAGFVARQNTQAGCSDTYRGRFPHQQKRQSP
jgi:hypothetical protein